MAAKTSDPPTPTETAQLPRGRHGLPRAQVIDSQRARTTEAMIRAVAERGYPETRVVDAINGAGVSRKTFYELFDDKEDCFLAAYDEVVEELFAATANAYESAPDAPWTERIRLGLGAMLEHLATRPEEARAVIVEVLAAGSKALIRRDAAIRQFTQFIDAGRAESKLELPGITSLAIAGGIYELLYTEILRGATAELPKRLPDVVYWVSQPYLGPARAAEERRLAEQHHHAAAV